VDTDPLDIGHLQRPHCTCILHTCDRSRTHAPGGGGCVSADASIHRSCPKHRAFGAPDAGRGALQCRAPALTFQPLSVVHSCSGGVSALQKCPSAQSECRRQPAPACWVPGHWSSSKRCGVSPEPPAGRASRQMTVKQTSAAWQGQNDDTDRCLRRCVCPRDCRQKPSFAIASACPELQRSSVSRRPSMPAAAPRR